MTARSEASTLDAMEFMEGDKLKLEDSHRWKNSNGAKGGYVANSARVDPTVFIHSEAFVMHDAVIGPGVRVEAGYYVKAGGSTPTISNFSDP